MTKVLIVGDTHADASFVSNIHRAARDEEVEVIVQLGDFGFTFDKNMIASIYAWLDRDPNHKWYWIDGNHDHHDFLDAMVGGKWEQPISMGKFDNPCNNGVFHDRLFYCPRGSTWEIGSTTCMALGGAYSIDKQYRKAHVSWWPQELITSTDLYRVESVANNKGYDIDVMFTHDAPSTDWLEDELNKTGYKVGYESLQNRVMLSRAVDDIVPTTLYHGHYHHAYRAVYTTLNGENVQVEGIGANVAIPMRWASQSDAIQDWNYVMEDF